MHNVVTDMSDAKKQGRQDFKNAYITADIRQDFTGADFRNVRLQDIKVVNASFTECDFSGATIAADITNVKFVRCNFDNAHFQNTHIHASVMKENSFQEAQFLHSSIRQTELSSNNFLIAQMDGVQMSEITIEVPNIHENTIRYGFPGATTEELRRMTENCINELSGMAEVYRRTNSISEKTYGDAVAETVESAEIPKPNFVRNKSYDVDYTNAIYEGINRAIDFQMNYGYKDKREVLQYLVDRYCNEEKLSGKYLREKLEEYNKIAEQKYGLNHEEKAVSQWDAAIEEALLAADVPEPEFQMEM